jgi:2-hydroxychromene-2-carboxylate isomerase
MGSSDPLTIYIDYKSPYAYLAIEPTYQLQKDFEIDIEWLPYTLDIPDFLGSAKVDEQGRVLEEERTAHQWRRVRYSYMDARRYATLRGLTIRGPQKIWDSTFASIGLLYAKSQGKVEAYNRLVYGRFWKRELDIESEAVLTSILQEAKVNTANFAEFLVGEGRFLHEAIRTEAEAMGVFGVPTYILDKELYWGREHLPLIRARLADKGLIHAKPASTSSQTRSIVDATT